MDDYERGDRFLEDLSYLDESRMSEFIQGYQSVFEIHRVRENENTGQTLYYLQSIKDVVISEHNAKLNISQ
jgi:hypothetical protein